MKPFRHTFNVQGSSAFPLDMLRYDGCYPLHEHEAHEITHTIVQAETGAGCREVTVQLVHIGERAWRPTEGRWQSFGWRLLNHFVAEW